MSGGSTRWAFFAWSLGVSRGSGQAPWAFMGGKLWLDAGVGFSMGSHGSKFKLAVACGLEVASIKPHIGGSVDSSTSGSVSMPIQVGGVNVGKEG